MFVTHSPREVIEMSDHLTPEDFFEFIDQGGSRGPAGRHLMSCPECLFELDFLSHPRLLGRRRP